MRHWYSRGNDWYQWESPIWVGAGVGFLTGFVGLFITELLFSTYVGGFLGAVGCGAAVAYRSEERVITVVAQALVADVVSSIAVFVLVYLAYITMTWVLDGASIIAAIWFAMYYVVFGSLIAVPAAIISLGITGFSATVASVILQLTTRQAAS